MRKAQPREAPVGAYGGDTLRVPVPVVADIPVPRDDLTPRYEGIAWAPMSAGVPARAVPTVIARTPERVGLSGSGGQTQTGQAQPAGHHDSGCEPRNSVHGWFLIFRDAPPRWRC